MAYYLAAFALLIHVLFWGMGFSLLITPRKWKRCWPVFAAPCGLALQSAVVWFGAHTRLAGTEVYAGWSEILPAALLAFALWRGGWAGVSQCWADLKKFNGVWLLVAVTLNALVLPMAVASKTLTTSSLGSCDAADYAAGARVLQEFASTDRGGFIGLTEVVRVASADNFFDFWLRLNHFTPSALVAFNGAIFDYQPYHIVGVTTAVFVALSLPVVFWVARAGFGFGALASATITAIYGASPLLWYAVAHVAMAQLLAAPAIALLTLCGVALWRDGASWRAGLAYSGLLFVAYWLILGSYNFIIVVALAPAAAFAVGHALWRNELVALLRWSAAMLAPLMVAGGVFTERTLGLIERFLLFRQFDFGWKIPELSPEGWLGMLSDAGLHGYSPAVRWALVGAMALVTLAAGLRGAKRGCGALYLAVCCVAPIVVGYGFLLWRGRVYGTNASYDAYKLLAVFYPGLLAGLCYWMTLGRRGTPVFWRAVAVVFGVAVLAFNIAVAARFTQRLQSPPLYVDKALASVQRVETMPAVTSVNMMVTDFWSRLWANSFLLRKPQYFPTHTYEGRLNTALKGEWDLVSSLIAVKLPAEHDDQPDRYELAAPFSVVNVRSAYFLRAALGEGWYDSERIPRTSTRWRWSRGDATIVISNPQTRTLNVGFRLNARSLVERELQVWVGGKKRRSVKLGTAQAIVRVASIPLPPGETTVELRSPTPPTSPGPGDGRLLGFAAYGIEVVVRPDAEEIEP